MTEPGTKLPDGWLQGKTRALGGEILRVKWMLLLAVAIIVARATGYPSDTSPVLLILYKPALAAIGFVAAHIGYQQAFPYIDQQTLLNQALTDSRHALLFAGTSVMRGLIYAAFILGVTLGL